MAWHSSWKSAKTNLAEINFWYELQVLDCHARYSFPKQQTCSRISYGLFPWWFIHCPFSHDCQLWHCKSMPTGMSSLLVCVSKGYCYDFEAFSTQTNTKRPKHCPLSFHSTFISPYLSFHSLIPYCSTSFQTLMLLIAYPEAHCTDSLSFPLAIFLPYFYLPTCKITTSYLSH